MISLAPRILALPADVRRTLAGVDGPGWLVLLDGSATMFAFPETRDADNGKAWWPANPAASVAAVTGWPIGKAHGLIHDAWCRGMSCDYTAALFIIEAHVANRSTHG